MNLALLGVKMHSLRILKRSAENIPITKGENNHFACNQRTALARARAECSHTPLHTPVAQQLHHRKRKTSSRSSNSHPFVGPQQNKTGIDRSSTLQKVCKIIPLLYPAEFLTLGKVKGDKQEATSRKFNLASLSLPSLTLPPSTLR